MKKKLIVFAAFILTLSLIDDEKPHCRKHDHRDHDHRDREHDHRHFEHKRHGIL